MKKKIIPLRKKNRRSGQRDIFDSVIDTLKHEDISRRQVTLIYLAAKGRLMAGKQRRPENEL